MEIGSDVFFDNGFTAFGAVSLHSAKIGGQFSCAGGRFENPGNRAFNCEAIEVVGDVYLRNGFVAIGTVDLQRAAIRGHLMCQGGQFGNFLQCMNMNVGGGFFWENVTRRPIKVDLTDAKVESLRDDAESWDEVVYLRLSGFRYARVISDMDTSGRLRWLGEKDEAQIEVTIEAKDGGVLPWLHRAGEKKFDPQPYSQLAGVLRAQGNAHGAARVLEVRERRARRAGYYRAMAGVNGTWGGRPGFDRGRRKAAHRFCISVAVWIWAPPDACIYRRRGNLGILLYSLWCGV